MEWLFLSKLILGHFMAYTGYATWLIIRFHNNQKQLNPSPRGIAIQWIIELFIGIILVMSISLKFDVLHSEFQFNTFVIGLFLIINLIGIKGVLRSDSFLGVPENVVLAAHDAKEKYINTQLSSKDILVHALTIQNVIETERLHLDPDLTLSSFSEILNLSPRVISQVINQHFGRNFSYFINEHRLTHAKHLLTSSTNTEKNISQVIYESGFNSKTRFYSLFKKLTNQSPKMYREQNSVIEI